MIENMSQFEGKPLELVCTQAYVDGKWGLKYEIVEKKQTFDEFYNENY